MGLGDWNFDLYGVSYYNEDLRLKNFLNTCNEVIRLLYNEYATIKVTIRLKIAKNGGKWFNETIRLTYLQ